MRKKELSILLSKLKVFTKPNVKQEQYPTDGENASEILWQAFLLEDLENKTVVDFGCGTGILGLGALLLGAKHCYFIDSDKEAIKIAKENLSLLENETKLKLSKNASFVIKDLNDFNKKIDTVLQNPPFGTKKEHADRDFLNKALSIGKIIYSFHKTSTLDFIKQYIEKQAIITNTFNLKLQLKRTMPWHKQKIKRIDVSCLRIENKKAF